MGFRRSRREFLSYATVAGVGALAGLALPRRRLGHNKVQQQHTMNLLITTPWHWPN